MNDSLELPTHNTIENYDVDVSDLSADDLDRLEDRVDELLDSGDVWDFPTDSAFERAMELTRLISQERKDRDPRRDDPYFTPYDTDARFDLTVKGVALSYEFGAIYVTLTLGDGSEFKAQGNSDIVALILDTEGLDNVRDAGRLLGVSLPVVGADDADDVDRTGSWIRIDRYALENGEPAI